MTVIHDSTLQSVQLFWLPSWNNWLIRKFSFGWIFIMLKMFNERIANFYYFCVWFYLVFIGSSAKDQKRKVRKWKKSEWKVQNVQYYNISNFSFIFFSIPNLIFSVFCHGTVIPNQCSHSILNASRCTSRWWIIRMLCMQNNCTAVSRREYNFSHWWSCLVLTVVSDCTQLCLAYVLSKLIRCNATKATISFYCMIKWFCFVFC